MDWKIPLTSGGELTIGLHASNPLFIVGANGSGKSALIQHAVMSLGAQNVRRISAHRQTWMHSAAIDITPQSRRQFSESLRAQDPNPEWRWREWSPEQRVSSVLFDLTAKDNDLARRIMEKSYAGAQSEVEKIISSETPVFEQVNDLLTSGGFHVKISNSKGEEILAQRGDSTQTYSMAQMSDGERNAVILAANVLTVESGIVLLIDEPERHLHRSIIEPLLSALFAKRTDCYFVISTHEIALPLANPEAPVVVVSSCAWNQNMASSWDARLLRGESGLPEDLRRAILGARRRVLFVEGESASMDIALYGALFTDVSVIPVGGCANVVKAVTGLRESHEHHDIQSFGLVDGDNRGSNEIEKLREDSVYSLHQYSVESLYYCSDAMRAVAERQAESLHGDAGRMVEAAKTAALDALARSGVAERLAARICERRVHEQIRLQMPDWKAIRDSRNLSIIVETDRIMEEEIARFRELLVHADLQELMDRYPVRETGALDEIGRQFDLSQRNYRKTLLARVRSDHKLAEKLRGRVGPLAAALMPQDVGNQD